MLLKGLIAAMVAFAGSVGLLKVSVAYENYPLLGAGLVLALAAVAITLYRDPGAAAA